MRVLYSFCVVLGDQSCYLHDVFVVILQETEITENWVTVAAAKYRSHTL
jgi:hypothetical protein